MVLFKAITVLFVFIYLPACFVYLLSPEKWWVMGLLSIAFPYLWFLLLLLVIGWFFIRTSSACILLILLLAGFPVMKNVFAFGSTSPFIIEKKPGYIRLMQWNCNGLQGYNSTPWEQVNERYKAVSFIRRYQPDIICMQDFVNSISKYTHSNISLLKDTLGYPYYIYTQHYKNVYSEISEGVGVAIFSRFPITDSGKIYYPGKKVPETIIWAKCNSNGIPLTIATTHFQSMHVSVDENHKAPKDFPQDTAVIIYGSKLDKLKYFQPYHAFEARYLRQFINGLTGPFILTSDMNSVPSSYVYNTIKGKDLRDAFLDNGFGLGKTYHSLQPALRIDYIFHNKEVEATQAAVFSTTFSDHDPVIMDFKIH